jgi:2-polyprenyl-3-methyl-5-hydroxy-6-metoxy-1,4-benzoquinol methylase
MAGAGPLSSHEVARRTQCAERYVREWLNSQVAGGYIDYHPNTATYELSTEQALLLADETSPYYMPFGWQIVSSMWADQSKSIAAFKTGNGISWGEHDDSLFCGIAGLFRNGYAVSLVPQWLPALTGVTDKLRRGAKVADVGCGHGHSTVLMAEAFPKSHFWGFDTDETSISIARGVATRAGVADRVTFEVARADSFAGVGYDLVCYFDSLHDMGRPVDAVRHAASAMAADGTMMIVEPCARDNVEDNINPVGRLYYAASTTMCCAHAISENGTHVLGAQAGPTQIGHVLKAAGLKTIRTAAESPFNLVFEARR